MRIFEEEALRRIFGHNIKLNLKGINVKLYRMLLSDSHWSTFGSYECGLCSEHLGYY
jgi:hypothetical protein